MTNYAGTTEEELRARLATLVSRMGKMLDDIGPVLVKIGTDREEARLLVEEMRKRGLSLEPGKDAT